MSFTDQQVLQQIQYTVIEPPDLGATWPSGLWTKDEVIRYLNQRQNRLLKDTHLEVGIADIPGVIGTSEYNMPFDWIATIRMVWTPTGGSAVELCNSDTWEADHGIPTWSNTNGTPKIFVDYLGATLRINIAPSPDVNGTFQIYFVPIAVDLDGTGELFTIPDEFVPYVKYGALADMLEKVGRGQDPRAEYCEKRYQMGIEIANMLLNGWK